MLNRRLGRFILAWDILKENPEAVRGFFNKYGIVVVKAEHRYDYNGVMYMGMCDYFDELAPNCAATMYEVKYSRRKNSVFIEFE